MCIIHLDNQKETANLLFFGSDLTLNDQMPAKMSYF